MLDLVQLLQIPRVDAGFDLSPDGIHIAFAWNKTGEWQIYEGKLDASFSPKPVTVTQGGKLNPRYSPDGTRLAYALDFDGSENHHLFVYNRVTGEHLDLTPNISHALQPNFCWSPDGTQLAFLSNRDGHFSAYTIPATGGEAQLILDTGHPAWQVEWSPDGRHLAVSCEMHGQDYGVFIVNLKTNEVTPVKTFNTGGEILPDAVQSGRDPFDPHRSDILREGDILLNAHDPKWSADGEKLVFHSDKHGWFDIGVYELESKEIIWITRNAGDSQSPVFLSRTDLLPKPNIHHLQLAYTQSRGVFNWIELTGGQNCTQKFQVGQGIHNGIKFTSDLKRMVTTFSSPYQPPDLWMIDIESGKSIQLTDSMPAGMLAEEFALPEEVVYPGMDGVNIPALLFRPGQNPALAVVMIHGGPNWHYSAEWNPVMAHVASRGFAVLAPNYRGSTGYGREWQYAARFDLGGVDTRDVAAGAQWLIREGIADARQIAVTGRSHGGYLTMTCLTQFPELWCGGSAVVPFLNWFKSHDESREDLQHWNIENMGDPKENYEKWYAASPYFFLERVNAPVQLICGGNDPRCPAVDSIDARDTLVALDKEVELLLYEDEGHSFLKIENVLDSEVKRVTFLAKALSNKPSG